ncbi:hypothetical protein O181_114810 [Austropuccinia psidii MF-1]|uniref:Retroviral polymerase SH3-like domain-containing protein n=1 Tax=Austropuccinia psidii MF-1 TaxID=1389203 RepID=A0A9Q3K956_9BASI|nr:hypothetical protein [Austropuccinia psidii MF-1]
MYAERLWPGPLIFLNPSPQKQFVPRGKADILLGYGEGHQSFCILELEKGKVTVTHHVKFNDSIFPARLNQEKDSDDDSLTISGKLIIQNSNNSGLRINNDSPLEDNEKETLPTELPQPTETSIACDQVPNSSLAKTISNPFNAPKQVKGYIWSNEPIDKSKEVIGDFGDPQNICDEARRKKYTENFTELFHNDPKNYKEAMCHEDSNNWKQAISQELRNMDKHGFLSPISNRK